ncbi:hypothetical protein [Paraburkholderia sp. J10-1]|uniref:hypothetical protein n=1 Tax=Paraburkholderia sp. J10-1 TaxID=2805430 RepID=UPI002AB6187E|nr:hypothetical protein [Paraburkholderia sp. J10-1]
MITFAPIRTRRLDVRLRELTIGDEIALCHVPPAAHEKAMSEFLARCVERAETPSKRHVADPRAWTVQERTLVLSHYCTHVRDDGPDYSVTETSRLSDYLDMAIDPADPSTFEACEDNWALQPLTGAAAETLETLQLEAEYPGREHWMIGVMAAQLVRPGKDEPPDAIGEPSGYTDWVRQRIAHLQAMPASEMDRLYAGYRAALEKDCQFFRIWFDQEGVIVLPKLGLVVEGGGAVVPPARFLVDACIGDLAISVTGKS